MFGNKNISRRPLRIKSRVVMLSKLLCVPSDFVFDMFEIHPSIAKMI
jgi:hypothetical protein